MSPYHCGSESRDRDSEYPLEVSITTTMQMHASMQEIVKELKKTLPSMSLSYLYRMGGLLLAQDLLKSTREATPFKLEEFLKKKYRNRKMIDSWHTP